MKEKANNNNNNFQRIENKQDECDDKRRFWCNMFFFCQNFNKFRMKYENYIENLNQQWSLVVVVVALIFPTFLFMVEVQFY